MTAAEGEFEEGFRLYETGGEWVIADGGGWLPGAYPTREAALAGGRAYAAANGPAPKTLPTDALDTIRTFATASNLGKDMRRELDQAIRHVRTLLTEIDRARAAQLTVEEAADAADTYQSILRADGHAGEFNDLEKRTLAKLEEYAAGEDS